MSFFRFVFSFLYVRNWHTGEKELSYPRVSVALGLVLLVILATISIMILQTPIEVVNRGT